MAVVAEKMDIKVERGPWRWALYTRAETMQSIPAFLWALKDIGGVVEDKQGGRAPAKIVAHAKEMDTPLHPRTTPGAMLRELERGAYAGAIKRVKGEKRTYRVELMLTDEQMPPRPQPVKTTKVEPDRTPVKVKATSDPAPSPVGPVPDPKTPPPGPRPDDPNVKPELAVVPSDAPLVPVEPALPPIVAVPASDPLNALLEIQGLAMQAVLGLAQQMGQGVDPQDAADRDAEKARLATTLEENQRLRRKVNDLTETLVAKGKEIEAMRRALMTAQSNLAAIQKASADAPDRERQLANLRATQKFMQAKPAVR
jgi:hypothetical protein